MKLALSETVAAALADVLRHDAAYRDDVAADLSTPEPGEELTDSEWSQSQEAALGHFAVSDLLVELAERVERGDVTITEHEGDLIRQAIGECFSGAEPDDIHEVDRFILDAFYPIDTDADHPDLPTPRGLGPPPAMSSEFAPPAHDARPVLGEPPPALPGRAGDIAEGAPRSPTSSQLGHRSRGVTDGGNAIGFVDRDEVLACVDLESLLGSLCGPSDWRRWRCPEPSHPDEHPSVTVRVGSDGVSRWRCWSGGHGGTAIDAVIAARGVDVGEAMRWLAANHTTLPVSERRPPPPPLAQPGRPDPCVAVYATQASKLLWSSAGERQRDWLAARGLRPEVLRANRVGADPGRRLLPRPKGLPGGWPAVVYPSMTPDGTVVYLQARYLDPPANRSKYDNPSAHLAANPRLAWTQPIGQPKPGVLVVCEGTADALVAAQAGFNAVGVLGAAYPDRRVADSIADAQRQHARLGGTVLVCFDGDDRGRAGASRLLELLNGRGVPTAACGPPDGMDLTSWALTDPAWTQPFAAHATAPHVTPTRQPAPAAPLAANRSISIDGIR